MADETQQDQQPDQGIRHTIYNEWANQGASPHAIAGVFANIKEESGFDPSLRHPDQPNWGGEAHYAHGLYQEGGQEWNNYSQWARDNHPGTDWRDPGLQSQFAAWNLKNNYPGTWQRMNAAASPAQAASIYAAEYLKPAPQYLNQRLNKFSSGVPGADDWLAGNDPKYTPSSGGAQAALNAGNAVDYAQYATPVEKTAEKAATAATAEPSGPQWIKPPNQVPAPPPVQVELPGQGNQPRPTNPAEIVSGGGATPSGRPGQEVDLSSLGLPTAAPQQQAV